MSQDILFQEYEQIVEKVEEALVKNPEWLALYSAE